ncbi:hypothetical protein MKW94_020319, partial [Papaver nudicaule]|nr:hypothetical protein [Papaver nudicaule]
PYHIVWIYMCSLFRTPRHITLPEKKSRAPIYIDPDNRKTLTQLLAAKWDPSYQAANVIMCNATATNLLLDSGWYYQACPRCSKKVAGDSDDLWCLNVKQKLLCQLPGTEVNWLDEIIPEIVWQDKLLSLN